MHGYTKVGKMEEAESEDLRNVSADFYQETNMCIYTLCTLLFR